eukprot:TRINITY_DN5858_c0_g3_i1.p1 TRINITY_DN5858_c0_g3~~TRINITY_DN5858_c0_g3_i1.p1  ORF type:complete len:1023 (+),score=305.38 TRINITY_DN5858_c0_g3_i1:105-3173(+)
MAQNNETMEGILEFKKKKWWFSVKEHKLFWYKNNMDAIHSGFIDLYGCSNVIPIRVRMDGSFKTIGFQLNSTDKKLIFHAPTSEDALNWIEKLNSYMKDIIGIRGTIRGKTKTMRSEVDTIREDSEYQRELVRDPSIGEVFQEEEKKEEWEGAYADLINRIGSLLTDMNPTENSFFTGEKVIWKLSGMKLHEFNEDGSEYFISGTSVITGYNLRFTSDDGTYTVQIPHLQIASLQSQTEVLSVVNPTKKGVLPNFLRSTRVSNTFHTQKNNVQKDGLSRKYICLDCKDGRKFRFSFPTENLASSKGDEGEKVNQEFEGQLHVAFPVSIFGVFAFRFRQHREEQRTILLDGIEEALNNDYITSEDERYELTRIRDELYMEEDGWDIYNATEELKRVGVPCNEWRITDINSDGRFCKTYPAVLAVPSSVTDANLRKIAGFRSMGRIPALTWRHPNASLNSVIVRCSQPLVGLTNDRCEEDEQLCAAVGTGIKGRLFVMDARPKVNAIANQAKGSGYENMAAYKNTTLKFLGIDNIHVVRTSLNKLQSLCQARTGKTTEYPNWLSGLESTGWLTHIRKILRGARRIAELVDCGSSVIIHCSDGWDRTSQLSALAQLMLDPYFRTIRGFEVLIEKDWLQFGHKFADRCGHLDYEIEKGEYSPIFLQFIDAVFQIHRQFPQEFEFNQDLLITIMDHVNSGLFGTFLCNSYTERVLNKVFEDTYSLWTYVNRNMESFLNSSYLSPFSNRKPSSTHMVHFLNPSTAEPHIVLWEDYYFRGNAHLSLPAQRHHSVNLFNAHIRRNFYGLEEAIRQTLDSMNNSQKSEADEDDQHNNGYNSHTATVLQDLYDRFFANDQTLQSSYQEDNMQRFDSEKEDDEAGDETASVSTDVSPTPRSLAPQHQPPMPKSGPLTMIDLKESGIIKEGALSKKGGNRHNWSNRWFVLTSTHLCYFKKQTDAKPCGQISLYGSKVSLSNRKAYCFAISTPERVYQISAPNDAEKDSWMKTIQEQTTPERSSTNNTEDFDTGE